MPTCQYWHRCFQHGPLTRYVKLRIEHATGMPGTFSSPPQGSPLFSKFSLALSGKLMVHLLAQTLVLLAQINFKWQWFKLALQSNGIKPRDMHLISRCYPIILPFPQRNENGCSNTSIWFYVVNHLWQFILNVVLIGLLIPFVMQRSPFGINNEVKSPWWKMLTTIENRIL